MSGSIFISLCLEVGIVSVIIYTNLELLELENDYRIMDGKAGNFDLKPENRQQSIWDLIYEVETLPDIVYSYRS